MQRLMSSLAVADALFSEHMEGEKPSFLSLVSDHI